MAAKLSGGGGGKWAIEQNSDINVTPFVDIMLVLLIIFMVAAPLATVSVEVKLPAAVAKPAAAASDGLVCDTETLHVPDASPSCIDSTTMPLPVPPSAPSVDPVV